MRLPVMIEADTAEPFPSGLFCLPDSHLLICHSFFFGITWMYAQDKLHTPGGWDGRTEMARLSSGVANVLTLV